MSSKRKIMVLAPSATGHLNPFCSIINELIKQNDIEVIFYSDSIFKSQIEKSGAQHRLFAVPTFTTIVPKQIIDQKEAMSLALNKMLDFSHQLLPQLIKDVEDEKPDLILYDNLFLPAKYLLEVLKIRYESGKSDYSPPKNVMFLPNFAVNEKVFEVMKGDIRPNLIAEFFTIMKLFWKQFWLSWGFGVSFSNPFRVFGRPNEAINIVGVTSEIQPFRNDFDSTFKFVGPCISEEMQSTEKLDDPQLNTLFSEFKEKSLGERTNNQNKLIYMSLGTIFNVNVFIFERAIEAIRVYDLKQPARRFKSSQFTVLMALGEDSMRKIKEKIESGLLKVPENVILRPRVPQLEVLKRADLFITHCGMNSVNEAIKFKVPIVAIPLQADQPGVARRVCDELSIGIRLNPFDLKVYDICDAIDQVLGDEKYFTNVALLCKSAENYTGAVEAAEIIQDYLDQKGHDQKKAE